MISPRSLARIAGVLYLIIIICAGFAEGFVRSFLVVPGDAAATAANIAASEGLFRAGLAADLVAFLADAGVAVLLYVLLRPVSETLSLLAAAFRLVAHPAIGGLNLLNHWTALSLAVGGPGAAALSETQRNGLILQSMEAHSVGYLLAGAFFGVSLAVLGYLVVRSEWFPAVLGCLLAIAGAAYLGESFTHLVAPGFGGVASGAVVVTAVLGEVGFCGWLIWKGVRDGPEGEEPSFA